IRAEVRLHPRPFFFGVSGASLYALMTVASAFVLGRIVDKVIEPRFSNGHVSTAAIIAAAAALIVVGLLKATGIIMRRVGATRARSRIDATLRERVISQYQALPLSWHQSHPTGELLAHVSADVEAATEMLGALPYATGVCLMVVVSVVWMLATDPFLAL